MLAMGRRWWACYSYSTRPVSASITTAEAAEQSTAPARGTPVHSSKRAAAAYTYRFNALTSFSIQLP